LFVFFCLVFLAQKVANRKCAHSADQLDLQIQFWKEEEDNNNLDKNVIFKLQERRKWLKNHFLKSEQSIINIKVYLNLLLDCLQTGIDWHFRGDH